MIPQPAPGLDEDLIPRDMAIDVVHGLEAVEIDDADDEALLPLRGEAEHFIQVGEELTPVRQIGEGVEIGEARVLVGEAKGLQMLLGELLLKIDHAGEVARMRQQDMDDRDRDQRQIDRHRRRRSARPVQARKATVGTMPTTVSNKASGTKMHQAEDAADHGDRQEERDLSLGVGVAVGIERDPPGRGTAA